MRTQHLLKAFALLVVLPCLLILMSLLVHRNRSIVCADTCDGENSFVVNGKAIHWTPGTTQAPRQIGVYIGSGFNNGEPLTVAAAVNSWFAAGGALANQNITVNYLASDPGANASNTIRIVVDPSAVPTGNIAYTGWSTNDAGEIDHATISFNKNATFTSASGQPALMYDPVQPNATPALQGDVAHELGHGFGLKDATNSNGHNSADDPACHSTSDSVMGQSCGTNNNGDGMSPPDPSSVTPTNCDNSTVQKNITSPSTNGAIWNSAPPGGGTEGGGGVYSGGGDGGSGQSTTCYTWEEWDPETNTLTSYTQCF